MSRIIHTQSNSTIRKRHLQGIAAALRYASMESLDEKEKRDILAFMVLSLKEIHQLNEKTITAWENRGYWLKADRFRLQWLWVQRGKDDIEKHLVENDLEASSMAAASLAQHLSDVHISSHRRNMKPWMQSWKYWNQARS